MISALIKSLRPKQWTKNLLLFAGIVFSQNLLNGRLFLRSLAAFVLFCLLSGGLYLINDVLDLERDRSHPLKSKRPIASGKLEARTAILCALILSLLGLLVSFLLSLGFGLMTTAYFGLILFYSLGLKQIVILDVLIIATGFVLRAVAGAVVIGVEISPWLLVYTIFLALFLALGKRRHELVLLGHNSANHRKNLSEYTAYLLDQMMAVVTTSTVLSYALYTMDSKTVARFGTHNLVFTVPFVLYGIFRYLYLVHQRNLGGNPEKELLTDKPILVTVLLWGIVVVMVVYL